MRLLSAHVAAKQVNTAKGSRWQVRWYLDRGAGHRPKERKNSTFERKGQAQAFVDNLHEAGLRANGWSLDTKGNPVRVDTNAPSVIAAVTTYLHAHWGTVWQSKQQNKVRGRMQTLVIETLAERNDRSALAGAFDTQRTNRGRRPEPVTTIDWAGRWLRDIGLGLCQTNATPAHADAVRLEAGRRWIEERSIRVTGLDLDTMARLRRRFASPSPNTERTYWSIITSFTTWLVDTKLVTDDPARGLDRIPRDLDGGRPEPDDIFTPTEIQGIANEMAERQNGLWRLWVLQTTYCSLRISESLAVNGSMYNFDNGRLFLNAGQQIDHDHGPVDRHEPALTDAKSTRYRTPRTRRTPVPAGLASELVEFFGDRIGSPTDHTPLFVGPRGAVGSTDTVRQWWHAAVSAALGDNHPRTGRPPHSMRHTGVTYWFAAGIDELRIARWGGWTSLKELLDTYRGVIDALEQDDLDNLDSFHQRWNAGQLDEPRQQGRPEQIDGADNNVVRLDSFRNQGRGA